MLDCLSDALVATVPIMAVLIEAISVVIRLDAIRHRFPGGWQAFKLAVPNKTLCADNEIARVGFMHTADVESYVNELVRVGLRYLSDGSVVDLVVVDQQRGPAAVCNWIEFGFVTVDGHRLASCRLKGSTSKQLMRPDGWQFEHSLSKTFNFVPTGEENNTLRFLRQEKGLDVYWNELTGKEAYLGRTGINQPARDAKLDPKAIPGVHVPETLDRAPIWPVVIAPLVAFVYYAALKSAFSISIVSALGETTTKDALEGVWGSHWAYRSVAEVSSVGLGTFLAAGLARGRERAAGVVGGSAIAFGFVLFWLAFLMFRSSYMDLVGLDLQSYTPEPNTFAMLIFIVIMTISVGLLNLNPAAEPWYQYVIGVLIVIASPFIGVYVSGIVQQWNVRYPNGFIGINRLHLIWLWLAAFCYALGLIEPVTHLVTRPRGGADLLTGILTGLPANAIPVIALLIPGYYGLALLSGHKGNKLHFVTRNLLGVIVLAFGFSIIAAIQYGLLMALQQD
jgi:hypothetical protein